MIYDEKRIIMIIQDQFKMHGVKWIATAFTDSFLQFSLIISRKMTNTLFSLKWTYDKKRIIIKAQFKMNGVKGIALNGESMLQQELRV